MIDPASTAFDFDGVVADTMSLFLDMARLDYGISGLRHEDATEYMLGECFEIDSCILEEIFDRINTGSYSHQLRPMYGAADALCRFGLYSSSLLVVTARPDSSVVETWFERNLGFCLDKWEIIATGTFEAKKDVLLGQNVKYFVEDRLETCIQLESAGIVPVLFKQPWNRKKHSYIEVDTWHDIRMLAGI